MSRILLVEDEQDIAGVLRDYPPFSASGGALLCHLLSELYEHTNVVITTT